MKHRRYAVNLSAQQVELTPTDPVRRVNVAGFQRIARYTWLETAEMLRWCNHPLWGEALTRLIRDELYYRRLLS